VPRFWVVGTRFGTHGPRRLLHVEGVADDQVGDGSGGGLVHAGDDVAVDLEREGRGGVSEALADDLGWDTGFQGGAGVGMPDVVQPDAGEAGCTTVPVE